jgi:hypothetical protein
MAYTPATPDQVKALTGSALEDASIDPFLAAASCVMLQVVDDCAANITDECKTQAEAFLASHLLISSNVGNDSRSVAKESLRGKYSVEYLAPGARGTGVLSTTYGQTANMILGGCLAELDKQPTNMFSIGSC